jgi:hypothetical protein
VGDGADGSDRGDPFCAVPGSMEPSASRALSIVLLSETFAGVVSVRTKQLDLVQGRNEKIMNEDVVQQPQATSGVNLKFYFLCG